MLNLEKVRQDQLSTDNEIKQPWFVYYVMNKNIITAFSLFLSFPQTQRVWTHGDLICLATCWSEAKTVPYIVRISATDLPTEHNELAEKKDSDWLEMPAGKESNLELS